MRRLLGKRGLITGGGRGLGRAIALAFAAEGASLVVSYARSADGAQATIDAAQAAGVRALALRADLRDREQAAGLVSAATRELGGLDILVNNAAVFSQKPLLETDDALWDEMLAINLTAPFVCARAAAPALLAAGGAIVNLASGGGLHPRPGYEVSPAYAASKAGLIMLSRRLALELGPKVRVNCIAPGVIDSKPTPMSEVVRARFAAATPLGRIGDPSNVADAAVFLASDESAFVTGQVLNVDGGLLI
jgi:3-oxoacyl-[acyl-carrier protein] reductase